MCVHFGQEILRAGAVKGLKSQVLVYDMVPPTTAVIGYAIGLS